MKDYEKPEIEELNIRDTADNGFSFDFGDPVGSGQKPEY